jgi:cytochrome c-type biogenesis protein CcmH
MTVFVLLATLLGVLALALLTRRVWWWRRGAAAEGTDAAQQTRPSKSLLVSLAALMLAVTVGGYAWLGAPEHVVLTPETARQAQQTPTPQQIDAMLAKLAKHLQEKPDDVAGWSLLARSYVSLGRHAEAEEAFKKALAAQPDNPDLLADYADLLASKTGGLDGEPAGLVMRALKADPNHLKALALAGTAAFNRKEYGAAVVAWEKALQAAPPDHPFAPLLRDGVAQARQLGNLGDGSKPATADAGKAAAVTARISGTVSLAPAIAAQASPDDTVFVFARAAGEGAPRVPLAILRKQVRDLPFEFTLDDSLAMSPAAKLSSTPRVIVGARVSKSGSAMPQSGDLQGTLGPVELGARGLKLEIGEVVTR